MFRFNRVLVYKIRVFAFRVTIDHGARATCVCVSPIKSVENKHALATIEKNKYTHIIILKTATHYKRGNINDMLYEV